MIGLSSIHEIIIGDLFRLILDSRRESISARVSKAKSNKRDFIFAQIKISEVIRSRNSLDDEKLFEYSFQQTKEKPFR